MRLALLTSDHIRHVYFARALQRRHDLSLVVAEEKGNRAQLVGDSENDTALLQEHFQSLDDEQRSYFGNSGDFDPGIERVLKVPRGAVNDAKVVDAIRGSRAEGIGVFGCGIIHASIFDLFPGRVINAHQGLSPYYRGSATNFWPFVNGELEYVGATVHYIDAGIDTGGIICHIRPRIARGDTMHRIGCRTIEASAEAVSEVFSLLDAGRELTGVAQWSRGRLYQRKDFSAEAVRRARRNIENGLIDRYAAMREKGDHPRIQLIVLA